MRGAVRMATLRRLNTTSTVVAVALAIVSASVGLFFRLDQKWHTAFLLVFVPFWVISALRTQRGRVSAFWTSFSLYLLVQMVLVWLVFAILLRGVGVVGMIYAFPIIMVETVIFDIAIRKTQRCLGRFIDSPKVHDKIS